MEVEELKLRFRKYASRIIKMVNSMPRNIASEAIAKQIVRSGTSPFANYRAACRAKSDKDFVNKIKIVIEEIDETVGWLELIGDSGLMPEARLRDLHDEGLQLTKIMQKTLNTKLSHMNLNS